MADKERLSERGEQAGRVDGSAREVGEQAAGAGAQLICASEELAERGDGVRFEIDWEGKTVPAFAIRHGGHAYAYLNRCAHIELELDWKQGKFFDADGEYLICSTHSALYAPESGACRGGPCRGASLVRLDIFEADGKVCMRTKGRIDGGTGK